MEWRYSSTFLNLFTNRRWVLNFIPLPLYSRGNSPRYSLDRRQGGPQSSPGRYKNKTCCPCQEKNPAPQSRPYPSADWGIWTQLMSAQAFWFFPRVWLWPLAFKQCFHLHAVLLCKDNVTFRLTGQYCAVYRTFHSCFIRRRLPILIEIFMAHWAPLRQIPKYSYINLGRGRWFFPHSLIQIHLNPW
jgi:hypothetical protein